jgi:hypothetical protein
MHWNPRHLIAVVALAGALGTASGVAAKTSAWHPIPRHQLEVTSGAVSTYGPKAELYTNEPEMRAVVRDGGRHASRARVWFRLQGASTITKPLGSGLVRRQIGLKLQASDPCNLVYVMWRNFPDRAIEISVKRNPGQTTSAQCGNNGYTDLAVVPIPVPASDHHAHTLEVHTRPGADGSLAVAVYTDGSLLRRQRVPAALAAGLAGPVGVRSDNGEYLFRLSTLP